MVAPTPTLSLGSVNVDLGSLQRDVTDIKAAVQEFATHADVIEAVEQLAANIHELRRFVRRLWWLDHMCRHVAGKGAPEGVIEALCDRLQLREPQYLESLTPLDVEKEAASLHEQYHLSPDDIGIVLDTFKPYAANLARQRASRAGGTATRLGRKKN